MIITCENCETSFNLNENLLKSKGSKVRCSRCKHMFTAYPPTPPEVEPSLADTVVLEETPDIPEEVDVPEPESIVEASGESVADQAGTDLAPEDADDAESVPQASNIEADVDLPEDTSPAEVSSTDDSVIEDLDLDFDMEPEETAPTAEDAIDDLDLDGEPEKAAGVEEDTLEDLDLGLDLEGKPDEATGVEEDTLGDLDLDLDLDGEPEEATAAEDDTLEDLDLDLELDLDGEPEETTAAEDDILEDLDLDLELDTLPEDEAVAQEDTPSEELDLSDMELSMDTESASETEADDELDLELDLDMDSDLEIDAGLTEEGDDLDSEVLDFSDFEETVMLDSASIPDTEDLSGGPEEELELDLDLEMADEEPTDAKSALSSTDKEDVELEDLDFELDMEFDSESTDDIVDEDDEDVDLSDIEKMLEGGGEEFETVSLGPDLDDVETEVEKWKESPEDDELMDQTGEIDLSDIMIDVEDDDIEEDIEDVELDLDIDEASTAAGGAMGGRPKPEDIDISGFEEFDIPEEGNQAQGDFSGGDIELEFEVDEDTDDLDGMATVSDFDEIGAGAETVAYSEPLVDVDEAPTKKKEKKKKVKKIKPARKSSITRPIMVLLIVLIIPLAAIVLLDRYMDINVPYVTDYLKQVPYLNQVMKSEMKTVGEIRVDNISSKFMDNTKHGKLFVITGTLKNEFPESRKYIRVRGSLFSTGKALAKDVTIYGGNVISDLDLTELSLTDINKRLSNRFGDKKSNFDVKPGRAIPFMVVFSDLPDTLEEFTIEAAGSFPVTTQQ